MEHRIYPARACSRATVGFSPQLPQTECPLGIVREVDEAMGVSGPDDSHARMMGNVRRSRLATGSSALFGACLVMLFLPLVSLRAQPSTALYNISGVVLDPSGSFVRGASVRLHQQEATIAQARTQEADGRFSFPNIPPGAYTVQVLEDEFELQATGRTIYIVATIVITESVIFSEISRSRTKAGTGRTIINTITMIASGTAAFTRSAVEFVIRSSISF